MNDYGSLVELLRSRLLNGNVFFLTGAGVSVASGIPDFQTVDEGWTFDVSREEALSVELLNRNPQLFWAAYKYLYTLWGVNSGVNSFHRFVAEVQKVNSSAFVLTQNIDGLHSAALNEVFGSDSFGDNGARVFELHGNKDRLVCSRRSCKGERLLVDDDFLSDALPRCGVCGKMMRPDVVLFGEGVKGFREANMLVGFGDVLLVAGTSLEVGPVNGLPLVAERAGLVTVWVNNVPAPAGYNFSYSFVGDLGDFVTEVGNQVLSN